MLIVANLDDYLDSDFSDVDEWIESLEGMTQNDVIQSSLVTITGQKFNDDPHHNNEAIQQDAILMSAIVAKEAGQETVNVELIRAVSRFDVTNNATGYTLVSASVWNAFPVTSVWESSFNDFSIDRANRFYGVDTETNEIKGGLYAFENYVTGCAQDDDMTTCLILGLVDDTDINEMVMYYRVNVNASNYGQQLKRNNAYNIKISRVKGEGEYTEVDAWSSGETLLDTSINEWNVDDQGNIQYDGENILAVPISTIAFGYEAETREYTIFALGEGTLEISKSLLDTGLSAELDGNVLKVSCTSSVETCNGTVELRFGNLKSTITITQTMNANLYLELSTSSVPTFPNTAHAGTEQSTKVMSSGVWTAKIYNGGFTFWAGNDKPEETGGDGDTFHLFTLSDNTNNISHYAFVHITLDEDPEISRTLVLTQKGKGGIDLTPADKSYSFTPTGLTTSGSYTDKYIVSVASDDDWEVIKSAGDDAFTLFDVTTTQFSVRVSENMTADSRSASYRVRLKDSPSVYHDIAFSQEPHSISLSHSTVDPVPTSGGISEAVTVTSTSNWNAEVVSNTGTVQFVTGGTTITSAASGATFSLVFPEVPSPAVSPSATVTLTIPGTPITASITVDQEPMAGKALTITSYDATAGSYVASNNTNKGLINIWTDSWKDAANFGPIGTVYVPSISWTSGYSTSTVNESNIYNFSNNSGTAGANRVRTWHEADDSHFVIITQYSSNSEWGRYVNDDSRGTSSSASIQENIKRTLHSGSANTKLMKFLLEEGPFTQGSPIDITEVELYSNGSTAYVVTGFESTMIPLIMDPTNASAMLLGIDPVWRIFYMGDIQMFSNNGTYNAQNWIPDGNANYKFMYNLQAWLTYAAQYGEAFIGDYK